MPVLKFRSFEEAGQALWCFEPDEAYFRSVEDFWNTINLLHPLKKWPTKGITKYRSAAEASRAKEKWLSGLGS